MRRLAIALLGRLWGLAGTGWLTRLLAACYARGIRRVVVPGASRRAWRRGRPTLLALNPDYFRGDLVLLSRDFQVLRVPFEWQMFLPRAFWPADLHERVPGEQYFAPSRNPYAAAIQRRYRSFLRPFLRRLYARLGVHAVISGGIHYDQDLDWGAVSQELGVPYLVLQRENMVTSVKSRERISNRGRSYDPFPGEHIIVHNQGMRQALTSSPYVAPDRISALGCLRMDGYVARILKQEASARSEGGGKRKQVLLFSFAHAAGMPEIIPGSKFAPQRDRGLVRLFDDVHATVGQLAAQMPEVDFVIRTKAPGMWVREVEGAFERAGLPAPAALPNLSISVDDESHEEVHDLILGSSVVVGYSTTGLIEAGVAGRPVIVPVFHEALEERYAAYMAFRDELHLFDVVASADELQERIRHCLNGRGQVSAECLQRRREVFEQYVSSWRADALDRYCQVIRGAILGARPRRAAALAEC